MNNAYIGLGSNLGDKRNNLLSAIAHLGSKLKPNRISSFYETEAWGNVNQASFINAVVAVNCAQTAKELMKILLDTEHKMGRERTEQWGARLIDLDILYFNDLIQEENGLTIPHPHLQNRNFVLVPLVEIAPKLVHPKLGKSNLELLDACTDTLSVRKIE